MESKNTYEKEKSSSNRRYKGQREELLKNLPHEKKLCTLEKTKCICEVCGKSLHSVGEEFIRTEVTFTSMKLRVIDYYRETFECRECRKKGKQYMKKSPMPYPVIQHSYASPSMIVWIIHQKYEMAISFYSQEKEWKELGLKMNRTTMANWIKVSYRDWLFPVVEKLQSSRYIFPYYNNVTHNISHYNDTETNIGVYLLLAMAKINGLNGMKYLYFILNGIPGTAFLEFPEYLEEYMPWNSYIQRTCR